MLLPAHGENAALPDGGGMATVQSGTCAAAEKVTPNANAKSARRMNETRSQSACSRLTTNARVDPISCILRPTPFVLFFLVINHRSSQTVSQRPTYRQYCSRLQDDTGCVHFVCDNPHYGLGSSVANCQLHARPAIAIQNEGNCQDRLSASLFSHKALKPRASACH